MNGYFLGWHMGFSKIIHLINPKKELQINWGKGHISFTFCGLATDGFLSYDPDKMIERNPHMVICKKCLKFSRLQDEKEGEK